VPLVIGPALTYPVPNTPIPKSNSYAIASDPRLCSYHLMGQHVSQDCGGGTQDAQSLRDMCPRMMSKAR